VIPPMSAAAKRAASVDETETGGKVRPNPEHEHQESEKSADCHDSLHPVILWNPARLSPRHMR
jgi:hypothetical protein